MFNDITSILYLILNILSLEIFTGGGKMNWKILAGVLLIVGLIAGFAGGKASTSQQIYQLNGKITQLSDQVKSADSLKNQLAETKAPAEQKSCH